MAQNIESPVVVATPEENQMNTGLQRHLSTKNVTTLALAGCLGLVELLPLGIGYGLWPSANAVFYLAIAVGFNLIVVLLYALISEVIPRSGAVYLFTSRVLHPPLVFGASFGTQIALAVIVGALSLLVSQAVLTPFCYYLSWYFQSSSLATFAAVISQSQGAAITGAAVVLLAFFTSLLPPKRNFRFLTVCIILALVGWAAIFFQLLTADSAHFGANWDLVMDDGSFESQITAARALALMFGESPNWLLLAGIPLGFLLFYGARLPGLSAGVVDGSAGFKQWLGGWCAVLVCGGLAVGSTLLVNRSIPAEWLAAESHLFIYNNQLKIPAMPWLPFYAALLRPNLLLFFLSTLGALAGLIAALQAFFRTLGHEFIAWTKDTMLPDLTGFIHADGQMPLVATLLVAILAQVGASVAALVGVTKVLTAFLFILVCLQIFPALAAVLYPWGLRKWVKSRELHATKGKAALLVICGLLVLGYCVLLIAIAFIYPSQGYTIGVQDIILLAAGFITGILWFTWRSRLLRKRGTRMAILYKDLPKE